MKKILVLATIVAAMFSCTKNEDINSGVEKLPINISVGQQTRANDTTYENEDEVGIYVVNYDGSAAGALAASGNQVDNMRFTYNNETWTPDAPIYWKDANTAADFYTYYPYNASANISAHPFSVQVDQSVEANFWASDFLWGKASKVSPTPNAVAIQTNHSLSRILIDIKPGNGFTAEAWAAATKSVKICDVKTSATIDLSTGVATATGNNGEITPLAETITGSTLSYKAMMIPQVVVDNSKLIVVTVDGMDYVYRKGYTFGPNTQHKFTITVNKTGSNVDVTIGEWDIDNIDNEGSASAEAIAINQLINYVATAKISPAESADFGATLISNEWDSSTGEGVIYFDGEIKKIADKAFMGCTTLTSITIPDGVTAIESRAFSGCSNLANVTIPNSVISIGDYAFSACGTLRNITIPENVTNIGERAFLNCSSLKSVFCKPTTPPALGGEVAKVFGSNATNRVFYVPMSAFDAYTAENSPWNTHYGNEIKGYAFAS